MYRHNSHHVQLKSIRNIGQYLTGYTVAIIYIMRVIYYTNMALKVDAIYQPQALCKLEIACQTMIHLAETCVALMAPCSPGRQ